MSTRREFMAGGSAALMASLTPAWLSAAEFVRLNLPPTYEFFPGVPLPNTRDMAEFLAGSDSGFNHFNLLYDEAHVLAVDLVEVNDGEQREGIDEFSMVFRSTWTPVLDEGTHTLQHPFFGRFPVYLRPVDRGGGAYYYEATICHLVAVP